jgi:hypothetical protein
MGRGWAGFEEVPGGCYEIEIEQLPIAHPHPPFGHLLPSREKGHFRSTTDH